MLPHEKYHQDFKEIVDLVWNVSQGKQIPIQTKSHLIYLQRHIIIIRNKFDCRSSYFEKDDISQELAMLWFQWRGKFHSKTKKKTSERDYLLQCSIFGMKNWFHQQMRVVYYVDPPEISIDPGFTLDLQFLVSGTHFFPLSQLSPYERYLIFLKFKEEKSILEISYIIQKNRETVSTQLSKIFNKLRSCINETQNTRRSSYPEQRVC